MLRSSFRGAILLVLAAFSLSLSSCAPSGPAAVGNKRIVFLTNGNDPFWDTCNAGLREGAKALGPDSGYTVVMDKANFTIQGQIDKLRQYATEPDIVGVAISAYEADNKTLADELRNLQKAGKKVITVDGDVNRDRFRDARTYYIGTDNLVAGKALGDSIRSLLGSREKKSGGYVQFAGSTVNDNARSRMNGVKEALGAGFTELDRMPDDGKVDKARDNVRHALDQHGDELVALVGIWAYNAPAIADIVTERKVRDKLTVGTFDAASDAITQMSKGNIDVMVVQNPFDMGFQAVRLLKAMVENDQKVIQEMYPTPEATDGDIYTTGLRVVVPDDKSPVQFETFNPKVVEFMTYPQFQAWLDKYGLKNS